LLDSDMRLMAGAVDRHLELLRSRPCVSVGSIRYVNARQNVWPRFLMTRGANRHASGSTIPPLDFFTANAGVRGEDLVAVGGFDEQLVNYGGEDTHFALKLHARGIPFLFNKEAEATAVESKTVDVAMAELKRYGSTNLRVTRAAFPEDAAPY